MEDTTRQFFKEKYPDIYKSLTENGKDFSLASMFRFANDYHQSKLNNNVVLADVVGQSEQLNGFVDWFNKTDKTQSILNERIEEYIKTL